ncbi:MAG: cytochrome c oxidase subunit 3 [Acidobacteriaceae bacterium]
MPAIITNAPTEVERKDTGSGGRPPVPRRPTGGGGGDENWGQGRPNRRPHELLTRCRMGLGFALAGDLIFFVSLVLAFYAQQRAGRIDLDSAYLLDWRPLTLPPILWINTAIMVLSEWTMEMARRSVFREIDVMEEWLGLGRPTMKHALPWLLATSVLGSLFITGQCIAWRQLYMQGVYFSSNPNSHFFYVVTGAHTVHLFLGVVALLAALAALWSSRRMEVRQAIVDVAAWYWHVMGVLWLFLFCLLLLAQ